MLMLFLLLDVFTANQLIFPTTCACSSAVSHREERTQTRSQWRRFLSVIATTGWRNKSNTALNDGNHHKCTWMEARTEKRLDAERQWVSGSSPVIIVCTATLQTAQIREQVKARQLDRLQHVCLSVSEKEWKAGAHVDRKVSWICNLHWFIRSFCIRWRASRPKGGAISQGSPREGRGPAGHQIRWANMTDVWHPFTGKEGLIPHILQE